MSSLYTKYVRFDTGSSLYITSADIMMCIANCSMLLCTSLIPLYMQFFFTTVAMVGGTLVIGVLEVNISPLKILLTCTWDMAVVELLQLLLTVTPLEIGWTGVAKTFLRSHGIPVCGHLAKEKGILLKIYASCRTGQDAIDLRYITRGITFEDGRMDAYTDRDIGAKQKTFGADFTTPNCEK